MLRIDAVPVLALLPAAGRSERLEAVAGGLGTPIRDRQGRGEPLWGFSPAPLVWGGGLLVVAAIAVALWPEAAREVETSAAASAAVAATLPASAASELAFQAGAASAAAPLASAPTPLVETVHSVPAEAANPVVAASGAASAQPLGVLAVRVSESSWIEVQDGGGQILLSRTVQPGESIGLDGALPLRLKIGNAAATQLSFRGQAVDLGAATQGNVARLELK